MTNLQKYEALIEIQKQLTEFASCQPNYHFKLYGGKAINEALQSCKKLVSLAAMDVLAEEGQILGLYDPECDNGLSIHNMN